MEKCWNLRSQCKKNVFYKNILPPLSLLNDDDKRKLIEDYKNCILDIGKKLNKDNYDIAVDIASAPDQIRGFGYVKEKNIKIAEDCQSNLIATFNESK